VELVQQVQPAFGLSAALTAIGLPRSTWYCRQRQRGYEQKHALLKAPLLAIAEDYPEYGYRRATDELSERLERPVNHKVVQKLNRLWSLALLRRPPAPKANPIRRTILAAGTRANLVAGLEDIGPFAVSYTDFTELVFRQGKAWLIPILDHTTKLVPGWALGLSANTDIALMAWALAKETLAELGWSVEEMIMHHDQDSVFTSYAWTGQLLLRDKVRISYALRGAKDNPEMESFNSRFIGREWLALQRGGDLRGPAGPRWRTDRTLQSQEEALSAGQPGAVDCRQGPDARTLITIAGGQTCPRFGVHRRQRARRSMISGKSGWWRRESRCRACWLAV